MIYPRSPRQVLNQSVLRAQPPQQLKSHLHQHPCQQWKRYQRQLLPRPQKSPHSSQCAPFETIAAIPTKAEAAATTVAAAVTAGRPLRAPSSAGCAACLRLELAPLGCRRTASTCSTRAASKCWTRAGSSPATRACTALRLHRGRAHRNGSMTRQGATAGSNAG
jgi:hypothetical protein